MAESGALSIQPGGDIYEAHRAEALAARVTRVIIGFSTPRSFNVISWSIRKITGSRASHAWLQVYDPIYKLPMVMEAHSTGMRLIPLEVFQKTNTVVARAYPRADFSTALTKVGSWLGEKYDFTGLCGMAWVLLGRWLHKKWTNPWNNSRALFCSEAVVETLRAANYPNIGALGAESTSPEDLLEFLQDNSFECRIDFTDVTVAGRRRRWRRRPRAGARPRAA